MSNQKKRQQQAKMEAAFEKQVSKRDKQIMSVLRKYVSEGNPFDRKQQTAFYSGAVWADENPKSRELWLAIGFTAGMIITIVLTVVGLILKIEGIL